MSLFQDLYMMDLMHMDLINTLPVFRRHHIWKTKVPLKIKKMWFLHRGINLTEDNLAKRRWQGRKMLFL
jgi:hypothetical protein